MQIFCPPSFAEGVRGWVFLDSTAVITSGLDFLESKPRGTSTQLQSSDLARKGEWVQLHKQNLYNNANNVDCHDSSLFDKSLESHNDGNVNSHNDEIFCQTGGVARSISKHSFFRKSNNTNRDISVVSLPQYDNKIDTSVSAKPQYDKNSVIASKNSHNDNNAKTNDDNSEITPDAISYPKENTAFLWLEDWRDTYFLYVYNLTPMRNPQYIRGELKGQISFRVPVIPKFFHKDLIFYLAFTNTFYFQLFNEKASSPMRDNDFEPEFLLTYRPSSIAKKRFPLKEITTGWRHISNGEIDKKQGGIADRSRGSDRFIIKARFSSKHWGLDIEGFLPTRFYSENRDIYKYLGSLETAVNMRYGKHLADIRVGGILGIAQPPYDIAKPHPTPYFRSSYTYKINEYYGLYLQYFVGYGDILYEYNTFAHRIGLGIRFVR